MKRQPPLPDPPPFGHGLHILSAIGQTDSWWVGLTREAFYQEAEARRPAMAWSKGFRWIKDKVCE